MQARLVLLLGLGLAILPGVGLAGNWSQFRGPNSGVSDEDHLPSEWAEGRNVRWKVKVPGYGWSSPAPAGGALFLRCTEHLYCIYDGGPSYFRRMACKAVLQRIKHPGDPY